MRFALRDPRLRSALALLALIWLVGCSTPTARPPTPVTVVMPTPRLPAPQASPAVGAIRVSTPAPPKSVRRAFDDSSGAIGGGWSLRAEGGAPSQPNALCQSGTPASILLLGEPGAAPADRFADGKVSAAVKLGAGGAAGLALRAQDEQNFYLVRADAAAGTVGAYRVQNGAETRLAEAKVALTPDRWVELRATIADNTIFAWLDARQVLSGADNAITRPGLGGLWAAANSGACFDDAVAEWR